ncbi:MAG: error-prone DNA polymerase [Anaerolineales bacterium]|nr:error-prone DNA polymerase [Anaerolineales bacterium]
MTAPGPYCELHAHSHFSLLDGVPAPEQLAERAAELGLRAIALTDHNALYGVVPFCERARARGVRPLIGAELTLEDGAHLTLLAETQAGYRHLSQLVTAAQHNAPKGEARLPWAELPARTAGLIGLTGCRQGPVARRVLAGDEAGARHALGQLCDLFGPRNLYVEVQRSLRRGDGRLSRRLAELAAGFQLKVVATGNVHYLTREEAEVQAVLAAVRERRPLTARTSGRPPWPPNHESFLRGPAAMLALYPDLPEAVTNTLEVAERCTAAPPAGLQVLPAFPTPAGLDAPAYLRRLGLAALPRRYPHHAARARTQLELELRVIEELGLANYFLIVWDIVQFCQRRGILCHGRGSAANSLVAYLLGLTAVDPLAQGLVFERFLSVEHGGTPDIDLDIDAARRERVIQYVYERWGREHAAMACTYVTYRMPSALRDAGFALGLKPELVEALAQQHEHPAAEPAAPSDPAAQQLLALAQRLLGRPRHLGLHNGGMIIAGEPLAGLIPVEPAAMEARTVVQWDKAHLEQAGIVKIDLLGLRMLAAIADTVALVRAARGEVIDLHALDFRERAVYDQICSGQTIGLFQVESGAQASLIPALQPRCFQDLVVEVSLIRPGPLQGNMVKPFIRRRRGLEPVTYPHPALRPALAETLGVIVFQEQVLKIARDLAGFAPGRGELLRRALSGKDAEAAVEAFRLEFLRGAIDRGVDGETARQVWGLIRGFAGYSFSKAHAAAFAVIVYWSAWLRVRFPAEYFCGLLRHAPLGTYPAHVLEAEARRAGVKFRPFDINHSLAKPTVEAGAIRHGLGAVKGIGEATAERLVQVRAGQPFRSLADFVQRAGLERKPVEALVLAGAFDRLGERRQLLWDLAEAFEMTRRAAQPALLAVPEERAALAPFTPERKVALTFAATGLTAGPHLAALRQDAFARAGCLALPQLLRLRPGARVRVGGLVADGLRRPPTAKGTSFIRLETPAGIIDVIIPPAVYAEGRAALRTAFLVVDGELQRAGPPPSVLAKRVDAL